MDPLNRTSAQQIVRFFDVCFKQGVLDAYRYDDNLGAREFLDARKADWRFGILGEPDDYDWEMWRFTLYRWARRNHMRELAEHYLYKITKKNYLWYLLPYCMRFYLMGVEEWLAYPNEVAIERFKQTTKLHFAPQEDRSLSRMTPRDYLSYMQEFAYEYRRKPEEERDMSAVTLDGFCQAIYNLTRKYDTGRKITFDEEE